MMDTRPTADTYTFWGGALSLFSGKVRSYLIKKRIPYREFYASHPDFRARMRPLVRLAVTPLLETPQGDLLQDSTDIIEQMEARLPAHPMIPTGPVQRVVSWLLDAYATEHLILPAMHYRWAEPYRSQQRHFLNAEFGRASHIGSDRQERLAAGARMMTYFNDLARPVGSTPQTAPAIERVYLDLLERLDIHFQHVPYLLGGRPSLADFGLMAPLYAHLGRDPAPRHLMALRAPNVLRWTERMNLAVIEDAEFPDLAPEYPVDDALVPTLEPVLQQLFQDWTPELRANVERFNAWLGEQPDRPAGQIVNIDDKRRTHPTLGPIRHELRGQIIERASAPQTLWHFEKAASLARTLQGRAREQFDALMSRVGGEEAMSLRLPRPIVRQDYVLVLG